MKVRFCAYANRDQSMLWGAFQWLAPSQKIRSWSTNGVFHDICEERTEDKTDDEAQNRDMGFVDTWLNHCSPKQKDKQR